MCVELSPEETGYLLGLIKQHLEYYRLLASNTNCSQKNQDQHQMLEGLRLKLAK
jgi:hypothetical protein